METLWILWLSVALLAGIFEMLSLTFGSIFVSIAALFALLAGYLGVWWLWQVVVFAASLVLLLLLLRPRLLQKMGSKQFIPSRAAKTVGQWGIVTERIDPVRGLGRVEVGGEDWAATSKGQAPIQQGAEILVEDTQGIVLVVMEKER